MMADMWYTNEELEAAEQYLRDRLRNEKSMSDNLKTLLALYAQLILEALFSNASDEEVQALIEDLVTQLIEDCETLAVDDHDGHDEILAYMHSEFEGDTLEGRVRNRVNTFFNECLAIYTAGRLLGKTLDVLLPSFLASLAHPWDNEFLVLVRQLQISGEISRDFDFNEPHFGKGVPISSTTALEKILDFAIGDAWMWCGYEDAKKNGAKGYFVIRGSNYPCDECDSHTGVFYRIDDEKNRPQYHPNCCCIVIYTQKMSNS